MDALEAKLSKDWYVAMALEIRYGKVREWTEVHDPIQFIGWAVHKVSGKKKLVSSYSTKQRAKEMALDGRGPVDIGQELSRPLDVINEWLGIMKLTNRDLKQLNPKKFFATEGWVQSQPCC